METQGADEEPSWSNFFGVTSKSKRQPSSERSKSKGAGEFSRNKERNWGDFGEEDSRGGDGRDKRVRRRRRRGRAAALACGWLAIALMSSELVAFAKKSPTTILGEDKPTFKAWDCHSPQQIQVLEVPEQCTNEKDDGDINKQADKTRCDATVGKAISEKNGNCVWSVSILHLSCCIERVIPVFAPLFG